MEARTLGLRLRAARRARGLRQEDAAKALGLPRTAVTQIESGNRSVSTLELTRLSKLYFRPISDLLREAPSDESDDVLTALNRAAPELKDDQDLQERVADCLLLCSYGTEFAQLLEILPRPRPTCYAMPEPRSPRESMIQGEEVAKQERRRLGIGNAQIADVAGLIASQGVWTTGIRFPDHISSLLVRHATIGSAILVNATLPTEDRRLAHAHAYAHLLHKRDCSVTVSLAKDLSETSEDQASAFAMAFLMPEEGIRNFLQSTGKSARGRRRQFAKDGASRSPAKAVRSAPRNSQAINCRDTALLAKHFGVGYRAAAMRLRNLGHINARDCVKLNGQHALGQQYLRVLGIDAAIDRQDSIQASNRDLRNEVTHLAFEAYCKEEISRGRLLELSAVLRIPGETLLGLAETLNLS